MMRCKARGSRAGAAIIPFPTDRRQLDTPLSSIQSYLFPILNSSRCPPLAEKETNRLFENYNEDQADPNKAKKTAGGAKERAKQTKEGPNEKDRR